MPPRSVLLISTVSLFLFLLGTGCGSKGPSDASSSAGTPGERQKSSPATKEPGEPKAHTPATPRTLRLRLEEGETFVRETDTEVDVVESLDDAARKTRQILRFRTRHRVESLEKSGDETEYLIDVEFERVRYEHTVDGVTVRFDSLAQRDEPPPPVAMPFALIIGKSYTTRVSVTGEILEIDGAEALIREVLAALPKTGGPDGRAYRASLREQFDVNALRAMEQRSTIVLPEHPVSIGTSWTERVLLETGIPTITMIGYKFDREENGSALISTHATIEPNLQGDVTPALELSGRQTGDARVALESGLVTSSLLDQDLSGTRRLSNASGEMRESTLSIHTTTRSTAQLVTGSGE